MREHRGASSRWSRTVRIDRFVNARLAPAMRSSEPFRRPGLRLRWEEHALWPCRGMAQHHTEMPSFVCCAQRYSMVFGPSIERPTDLRAARHALASWVATCCNSARLHRGIERTVTKQVCIFRSNPGSLFKSRANYRNGGRISCLQQHFGMVL